MCFAQDKAKRERYGHWMFVPSGIKFYPLDPRAEEIEISDIALSLSRQSRYNGCFKEEVEFYSVAEHSVYVSEEVEKVDASLALEALMHDSPEAYLGDFIRPLKKQPEFEEAYARAEKRMELAIRDRFGLAAFDLPIVKAADEAVTAAEVRQIINGPANARLGYLHDDSVTANRKIRALLPRDAARLFSRRFELLWAARNLRRAVA